MITTTVIHKCRDCESENIVKNGRNVCGKQQYRCKDCGASKVLEPTVRYSEEQKAEILRIYREKANLQGVIKLFGISRPTLNAWLKNSTTYS